MPKKQSDFAPKAAASDTMMNGPNFSDSELHRVLEALASACEAQAALRDMAPDHRKPERSTKIAAMLTLIHRLRREPAQPEQGAKRLMENQAGEPQMSELVLFDADVLLMLDALSQWHENEAREVPDSILQKLVEEAMRRNLYW